MIRDIQDEIIRLKKEKNICILAHSYQAAEILEVADYTGDSFQLSVMAQKTDADTVIMCGVKFMAETVKMMELCMKYHFLLMICLLKYME